MCIRDRGYRLSRITKITRKVALPSQVDLEIGDALSTGVMESLFMVRKELSETEIAESIPDLWQPLTQEQREFLAQNLSLIHI